MTCLAAGLLESARLLWGHRAGNVGRPAVAAWRALGLLAVTVAAHVYGGYLPLGGRHTPCYAWPVARGMAALDAAAHVPGAGLLLCAPKDLSFCANRAQVITWESAALRGRRPEWVLSPINAFAGARDNAHWRLLRKDGYGVHYLNDVYAVLRRDGGRELVPELERRAQRLSRTISLAFTAHQDGRDIVSRSGRRQRLWEGQGRGTPPLLAYGKSVALLPGTNRAHFVFVVKSPKRRRHGNWGQLQVCVPGVASPLATQPIVAQPTPHGGVTTQALDFVLSSAAKVEPRVVAGDAGLLLDEVYFE
ncbi:MAG: hypothetical protein PHR35_19815 [Kiritimatiellae bacterium]|nr:hypothetical protein [Kiritimatiellia bacterium]